MAQFVSAQFRRGRDGRPADSEHRVAARDAPRARAREQLDAGQRASASPCVASATRSTCSMAAAIPATRRSRCCSSTAKVGGDRPHQRRRRQSGGIATQLMNTVGEAVAKAAAADAGTPAPTWDPAWSRFAGLYRGAWRRLAGRRTEPAPGRHQAERAEARQPDPPRADRQRPVPLHRADRRRPGRRGRPVRRGGRPRGPDDHRRQLRRAVCSDGEPSSR